MDLTAGINADFLLFPLLSFNAGSSTTPKPPGPMLLLRVLREDFLGDKDGALLKDELAVRPSAIFSLPELCAMFGD
jgi:hypothetical protein